MESQGFTARQTERQRRHTQREGTVSEHALFSYCKTAMKTQPLSPNRKVERRSCIHVDWGICIQ